METFVNIKKNTENIIDKMSIHDKLYVTTELFVNKIDGTDLKTSDWSFLGTVDQDISSTDEVNFKTISVAGETTFKTTMTTAATGDYTLTFPVDDGSPGQCLTTNGSGILSWTIPAAFDQSLNMSDSVTFAHITATAGLDVQGTLTTINTTNLEVTDNIIVLNDGELGSGVSLGISGIEIDRGTATNAEILYNETNNYWTLGDKGGVLGLTINKIVESANTGGQTQGAISVWDINGRLSETGGIPAADVTLIKGISAAQWGYLGAADQNIDTTAAVNFAQLTVDDVDINNGAIAFSGATGVNQITIPDNLADAFSIREGSNDYMTFDTTNGAEFVNIYKPVKLFDITAPSNPLDGEGLLYKKIGDSGLYWRPDSSGPEVNVTNESIPITVATGTTVNATVADKVIRCTSVAGAITVNLPLLSVTTANSIFITNGSASQTVTVKPQTGERLDGVVDNTVVLSSQYDNTKIISDGVSWYSV